MKYKILLAPRLIKLLTWNFASAMAIYPFILIKNQNQKKQTTIINHELIHLQQQKELFILPFYFLYIIEYSLLFIFYLSHHKAYKNISFEKEAYQHEKDLNYLKTRNRYAFTKYWT